MLHRFPPAPSEAVKNATFLAQSTEVFAKLKIESVPGKRTVLMTEHTLIFIQRGVKLLHFPNETVRVSPGEVFLLRKGIYVMAEYTEESTDFEAIMLFLPGKLLRSMTGHVYIPHEKHTRPYLVFDTSPLLDGFKEGLRKYFDQRPEQLTQLLSLKQQEALLLLLSGPMKSAVQSFINSAISSAPADMDFVIREYLLRPVTIKELAALCNCSLAKFKRDFQRRYNTSPRIWINTRRLEHAIMLLQNTDKPVNEIASDCGFENVSYFIRLFREHYGHTPATARAKIAI